MKTNTRALLAALLATAIATALPAASNAQHAHGAGAPAARQGHGGHHQHGGATDAAPQAPGHGAHGGHGAGAPGAPSVPYQAEWDEDMAAMHADMDIRLSGNADLDFLLGMMPHHAGALAMAEFGLEHARDPAVRWLAQNILWDQQREINEMETLVVRRHLGSWPDVKEAAAKPSGGAAAMGHGSGGMGHGATGHHGPGHGAGMACTPDHAAMGHCVMAGDGSPCTPDHAAMGHCVMAAAGGPRPPYAGAWDKAMAQMHAGMAIPLTGDPDVDFLQGMIAHHQGALDMAAVQLDHGWDPFVGDFAREVVVTQSTEIEAMRELLRARGLPARPAG